MYSEFVNITKLPAGVQATVKNINNLVNGSWNMAYGSERKAFDKIVDYLKDKERIIEETVLLDKADGNNILEILQAAIVRFVEIHFPKMVERLDKDDWYIGDEDWDYELFAFWETMKEWEERFWLEDMEQIDYSDYAEMDSDEALIRMQLDIRSDDEGILNDNYRKFFK